MTDHSKTKIWRIEDLLPAKDLERGARPNFAQTVVGSWGVHDASAGLPAHAQPRIEPKRVVVVQSNNTGAALDPEHVQARMADRAQGAARARHTAEAWAAGASVGAKTELRRLDEAELQAAKAAPPAHEQQKSSPTIVIPKLPAAAQLARLKVQLSRVPQQLRKLDRRRIIVASALLVTTALVPLIPAALRKPAPAQRAPEHIVAAAPAAPKLSPEVEETRALEAAAPAQPAPPPPPTAAAESVTPRAAVDALIAGNPQLAAERYQALARSHPDRAEYAAAARILKESAERAAVSGNDP